MANYRIEERNVFHIADKDVTVVSNSEHLIPNKFKHEPRPKEHQEHKRH